MASDPKPPCFFATFHKVQEAKIVGFLPLFMACMIAHCRQHRSQKVHIVIPVHPYYWSALPLIASLLWPSPLLWFKTESHKCSPIVLCINWTNLYDHDSTDCGAWASILSLFRHYNLIKTQQSHQTQYNMTWSARLLFNETILHADVSTFQSYLRTCGSHGRKRSLFRT